MTSPRRPSFGGLVAALAGAPRESRALYRPYRQRELGLLVAAGVLATAALASLTIAHDGRLTSWWVGYLGLGFFALWGAAHLAVRHLAPAADPLLLPLAAALNGLGLVMIRRIDLERADAARKAHRHVLPGVATNQLVWTFLALLLLAAVLVVVRNHNMLARYTFTAGLTGLFLLVLPAAPGIGTTINGARLWLRLGPFTIQPSEFSKILLAIFLTGVLRPIGELQAAHEQARAGRAMRRGFLTGTGAGAMTGMMTTTFNRIVTRVPFRRRLRMLAPAIIVWIAGIGVMVVERDLGSSLLMFGMFLVILYVATQQAWLAGVGLLGFAGAASVGYYMFGHVRLRVDIWLHAFNGTNPSNSSYQLVQGLYGFAAGGLTGTGLGEGQPNRVPFANTDFIMASLGEELGLTGVMAILVLYLLIVVRGMRIALSTKDAFGKMLACGLAASIGFQVFVQVGGVMRLIPLTGVTLPFVSYGGSSMVANTAIIALLLRISDSERRRAEAGPEVNPDVVADLPTTFHPKFPAPEAGV
jgi:cell division protein FtsW (lipid II flippase)